MFYITNLFDNGLIPGLVDIYQFYFNIYKIVIRKGKISYIVLQNYDKITHKLKYRKNSNN